MESVLRSPGDSVSDAVGEAALDVLIPVGATALDFGPTADLIDSLLVDPLVEEGAQDGATNFSPVSYTHLTLPTTPYV